MEGGLRWEGAVRSDQLRAHRVVDRARHLCFTEYWITKCIRVSKFVNLDVRENRTFLITHFNISSHLSWLVPTSWDEATWLATVQLRHRWRCAQCSCTTGKSCWLLSLRNSGYQVPLVLLFCLHVCCLLLFTPLYCKNVVQYIWIRTVDCRYCPSILLWLLWLLLFITLTECSLWATNCIFISYSCHVPWLGRSVARLSLYRTGIGARLVRLEFMVDKVVLLLFRFNSVTLPVLLTCRHVNTAFIGRTSGRILGTSKQSKGVSDVGGRVDRRSACKLVKTSSVRQ